MAGKSTRPIVVISVLAVLALVALFAFSLTRIKPISEPAELTLSDGTIVKIEALTFGTEHSFSTNPVRDKLRRWLPKRFQGFLKTGFSSKMQTAPYSLVIWVSRTAPSRPMVVTARNEWHYTTDGHGCRFHSSYRTGNRFIVGWVTGIAFDNFPRGEDTFDYVVGDGNGNTLVRFKIANPFKVTPKRQIAETAPITKTNGGLVVQLRRMQHWSSAYPQMPLDPDIQLISAPDLESWDKPVVRVFDWVGNSFPGAFCTNESRWRIEANFYRRFRARFRPEEMWLITNVAVPPVDGISYVQKTNTLQGAVVAVASLQGAIYSEPRRPNAVPALTIPPDGAALLLWIRQRDPDSKLLVRARDDAGRTMVVHDSDRFSTVRRISDSEQHRFEIQPWPNSKSLNIEVIIQKPVRFEFFVESKKRAIN